MHPNRKMENFSTEPYEEERRRNKEMKRLKKHYDMVEFVADAQYGIPTKCPCGGQIKHNVSPTPTSKHDFDTLPGCRYFTCTKFEDDGLHFRQPWVFGVEEEILKLIRKAEEQSQTIEEMRKEIQSHAEAIAKLK